MKLRSLGLIIALISLLLACSTYNPKIPSNTTLLPITKQHNFFIEIEEDTTWQAYLIPHHYVDASDIIKIKQEANTKINFFHAEKTTLTAIRKTKQAEYNNLTDKVLFQKIFKLGGLYYSQSAMYQLNKRLLESKKLEIHNKNDCHNENRVVEQCLNVVQITYYFPIIQKMNFGFQIQLIIDVEQNNHLYRFTSYDNFNQFNLNVVPNEQRTQIKNVLKPLRDRMTQVIKQLFF